MTLSTDILAQPLLPTGILPSQAAKGLSSSCTARCCSSFTEGTHFKSRPLPSLKIKRYTVFPQDDLYLHYLTDACHDAVRRLLGPRKALLWNRYCNTTAWCCVTFCNLSFPPLLYHRETAAVAQILYFGLTTGAGVQTLGEEYCDILQVSGKLSNAYTALKWL